MKTLAELQAIRDKMKSQMASRGTADGSDIKIVVGRGGKQKTYECESDANRMYRNVQAGTACGRHYAGKRKSHLRSRDAGKGTSYRCGSRRERKRRNRIYGGRRKGVKEDNNAGKSAHIGLRRHGLHVGQQ